MDETVRKKILDRQRAEHYTRDKKGRPWCNIYGYSDPTACIAIANIIREEKKTRRRKKYNYHMA